ncbi:hypothetical protein HY480_01080 [Candidatus Uhrbacteria bacterium]|nr:hypothetical protein [Candidatus Uhrbacteria bacterium]
MARTTAGFRMLVLAFPVTPLLALFARIPADAPIPRYEFQIAADEHPPRPFSPEPVPLRPQPVEHRVAALAAPLRLRRPSPVTFDEISPSGIPNLDPHNRRPHLRRGHFW